MTAGRLALAAALACAACAAPMQEGESRRVWSTANSNDGYAACPGDTTVTGGGFEIKEADRALGHVPLVVASRPEKNGWRVICTDPNGTATASCRSWAVCASVLAH